MVSDTTKAVERNVYDKVAKDLYKEYSPKFPSIQASEYRDYISYFGIKSVQGFKKSLGIEKSDRGFSKMKMMERLEQARAQSPQRSGESFIEMRERAKAGAPERAKVREKFADMSNKGVMNKKTQKEVANFGAIPEVKNLLNEGGGYFAYIVPVHKELTPAQLKEVEKKVRSVSAERVKEAKAKKKEPKTGEIAGK